MLRSVNCTFRPLQTPPRNRSRKASPFSAKWRDTCDLLDRELHKLNVKNVVIQLHCGDREIRLDGMPRADARVMSPAVAISFECRKGTLTFPCDAFNDWHSNVRAIALGLEALRKIERYGITPNNEQYTGWNKLPGPAELTHTEAMSLVFEFAERQDEDLPLDSAVKRAKARCHPDRNGGDNEKWNGLQKALSVLENV